MTMASSSGVCVVFSAFKARAPSPCCVMAELARHAPELRTTAELLPRVWGPAHSGRPGAVRTLVKQLRRKLGDEAETSRYVVTEPRVGCRMPRPDRPEHADSR